TERLQLIQNHLPEGVPAPQLAPILAPISAILKVCLTSSDPDSSRAARDLRAFADWTMRPRVMSVPGVAQVVPLGGDVERIEVRPDPLRMRQRKVTMTDIVDAVHGSQSVAGVGFTDVGASRLDIHSEARLTVADAEGQLAGTVVGAGETLAVRLGEVADVVRAPEPPMGAAIYDGRPAVYVQISKLPWADTLTVTRDVERA